MILNSNYSTTRLVSKGKPIIMKQSEDKFETILFLPEGENRQGVGGLRTKGYFKHSYEKVIRDKEQGISEEEWRIVDRDDNPVEKVSLSSIPYHLLLDSYTSLPLISIITVVYNGEKYLEETIQSVINQTYPNVEYIIINGGSTDGTIDIIKKYENKIDYWVSEPDDGIYYAMNKGIDLASGRWINFMNAGDRFYDDEILEKVFVKNKFQNVDVIYGDHQVIYPNRKKIAKTGNIHDIWKGSQFCHQSAFIASMLHKQYKYNIQNRIGADFEFFYTMFKNKRIFKKIDIITANYLSGGLSDIKRIDSIVGRWNIIEKTDAKNIYYIYIIVLEILKKYIKKILNK